MNLTRLLMPYHIHMPPGHLGELGLASTVRSMEGRSASESRTVPQRSRRALVESREKRLEAACAKTGGRRVVPTLNKPALECRTAYRVRRKVYTGDPVYHSSLARCSLVH